MKSDKLDELIDGALSGYSLAEPSSGFEKRILNRIQSAPPPFSVPGWMFAAAAMACVLVLVLASWPRRNTVPRLEVAATHTRVAETRRVIEEPRPQESRAIARAAHPALRTKARPQPFPSPAPLTEDERALLDFATRVPAEALKFSTGENESSIQPIKIEEIQIQSLRSGD